MSPVTAISQVFDAIQKAKTGASAFCTNFFPVQAKIQTWIDHAELLAESRDGAAFFLRRDQDFWHWYFCAADLEALRREIPKSSALRTERVVVDVIGKDGTLDDLLNLAQQAGFKRHSRLLRLSRPTPAGPGLSPSAESQVMPADKTDVSAILRLLSAGFDRYADQLPTAYEIEAAIEARQILAIRCGGELAALLFFETQGVTSAVRYWMVDERFRANRLGSALIRHYFAAEKAVRRFVLWVTADNQNAVEKYRHYGYSPDGLVDYVLVNEMIRA